MIDSHEAARVARETISASRGAAALEGRREVVVAEDGNWHVSFPYADPDMLGGEPHVIVGPDGSVVSTYSSQ